MMKFGMKFTNSGMVELIDMETAEILAEGQPAVQQWLTAYDGGYTLTLIQSLQALFSFGMVFAGRARSLRAEFSQFSDNSEFIFSKNF